MGVTRDRHRSFLDRWQEIAIADPHAGAHHAERCLELAAELGYPPEIHARALTLCGSSYRMLGELDQAENVYTQALRIYDSLEMPPGSAMLLDDADLRRRFAYLRAQQGQYSEALELARWAGKICAAAKEDHLFGKALLARATVLLIKDDSRCIPLFYCSLSFLDFAKWRDSLPAVYNLCNALTLFTDLEQEDLEGVLEGLTEARLCLRSRARSPGTRKLLGYRRRNPTDACIRFLQGRVLVMLRRYDEARPLLETAREDFAELRMFRDLAAAGLELCECARWLSGKQRWFRITSLCHEILAALANDPDSADAITAYRLLLEAAEARCENGLRDRLTSSRTAMLPDQHVTRADGKALLR